MTDESKTRSSGPPASALANDRAALLVYDMQVGILRQLKDVAPLKARVTEALAVARNAGLPVFFLRHTSLPRKLMGAFQLRQAMAWQRVADPDEVKPWFLRGRKLRRSCRNSPP